MLTPNEVFEKKLEYKIKHFDTAAIQRTKKQNVKIDPTYPGIEHATPQTQAALNKSLQDVILIEKILSQSVFESLNETVSEFYNKNFYSVTDFTLVFSGKAYLENIFTQLQKESNFPDLADRFANEMILLRSFPKQIAVRYDCVVLGDGSVVGYQRNMQHERLIRLHDVIRKIFQETVLVTKQKTHVNNFLLGQDLRTVEQKRIAEKEVFTQILFLQTLKRNLDNILHKTNPLLTNVTQMQERVNTASLIISYDQYDYDQAKKRVLDTTKFPSQFELSLPLNYKKATQQQQRYLGVEISRESIEKKLLALKELAQQSPSYYFNHLKVEEKKKLIFKRFNL